MPNRQDAGMLAYTLVEYVADQEGEETLASYLARVVDEVMELVPAVRQHISDTLFTDLKEEIARREDAKYARATIGLIEDIENYWRNERQ